MQQRNINKDCRVLFGDIFIVPFLGPVLGYLTAMFSPGWGNLVAFDWKDLPAGREFDCKFLKILKFKFKLLTIERLQFSIDTIQDKHVKNPPLLTYHVTYDINRFSNGIQVGGIQKHRFLQQTLPSLFPFALPPPPHPIPLPFLRLPRRLRRIRDMK